MKILVIEDDEGVRKFVCKILISSGYDVVAVNDGNEALAVINNSADIDIVVTDLLMPGKDGIEIIMEIKRAWPQIKILAISGGGIISAEEYLRLADVIGADGSLKKPFVGHDLLEAVERLSSRQNPGMKILVVGDGISEGVCSAALWNRLF